ncbi:MAG TPA: hypothetical protein VFT49_03740 [Candidatus Saccharimonadales bacterium]|nr:hypothetical protein [Candidatus Saccharimonadales bacterium]
MVRKTNLDSGSPEDVIDVFEAIKRAVMRRGLIRQKTPDKDKSRGQPSPRKLIGVAVKSHDILFKANTVFPFTLFPDTITLDREKLTIATRAFFKVATITSTPIRDILSVEANVGPFFGSVRISSRYFVANPYSVNFMWRGDALLLQRLLQGYIIAHEQEIDCADIEKDRLIILLKDLGVGDTG